MILLFCISQKHYDSGNSLKLPCRTFVIQLQNLLRI